MNMISQSPTEQRPDSAVFWRLGLGTSGRARCEDTTSTLKNSTNKYWDTTAHAGTGRTYLFNIHICIYIYIHTNILYMHICVCIYIYNYIYIYTCLYHLSKIVQACTTPNPCFFLFLQQRSPDSGLQTGPLVRPHPFPQYFPAGSDLDYGHLGHDVQENPICNKHLEGPIRFCQRFVFQRNIRTLHQIEIKIKHQSNNMKVSWSVVKPPPKRAIKSCSQIHRLSPVVFHPSFCRYIYTSQIR